MTERILFGLCLVVCGTILAHADTARPAPPEIHYSPAENLEHIDVALIDRATKTIDLAAYVLTDRPVAEALARAARRGVAVRVYRSAEVGERGEGSTQVAAALATPGIAVRRKTSRVFMHLKSYAVDGRWLRTGAANFSASGEKRQDNDLVILDDPRLAAGFARDFEAMWGQGEPEAPTP